MAKRRKKRRANQALRKPDAERDHMARVHVSDEVWTDFRAAAGGRPLNLVLGKLVQREVDRHRSRRLREGSLDDAELLDALGRARELREDLEATVARIEWRLDRFSAKPPAHPGEGRG